MYILYITRYKSSKKGGEEAEQRAFLCFWRWNPPEGRILINAAKRFFSKGVVIFVVFCQFLPNLLKNTSGQHCTSGSCRKLNHFNKSFSEASVDFRFEIVCKLNFPRIPSLSSSEEISNIGSKACFRNLEYEKVVWQ